MTSSPAAVVREILQVCSGSCKGSKYIVAAEERGDIPVRCLSEGLTIPHQADMRCQASLYVIFDNNCKRIIRYVFHEIIRQKGERDGIETVLYAFFLWKR